MINFKVRMMLKVIILSSLMVFALLACDDSESSDDAHTGTDADADGDSDSGNSDDFNPDLSSMGIPAPENLASVQGECSDYVAAANAVCGSEETTATLEEECIEKWRLHDGSGCGAALRANLKCVTENAADIYCDSAAAPTCSRYSNAIDNCLVEFSQQTTCALNGDPEVWCTDGGTYSYLCMPLSAAPFDDCTEVLSTEEYDERRYCCH